MTDCYCEPQLQVRGVQPNWPHADQQVFSHHGESTGIVIHCFVNVRCDTDPGLTPPKHEDTHRAALQPIQESLQVAQQFDTVFVHILEEIRNCGFRVGGNSVDNSFGRGVTSFLEE